MSGTSRLIGISQSIPPNAITSLLDELLHFNYPIQVASVVKDLGVLIDHSYSPSIHCKEAASKARRMLFIIKWPFAELSVSRFAPLYNAQARHHLEYAMQACSPNLVADVDCLEQIQRLATRLVKGFR